MKRKIVKLGTATLVTSLPSKWIKRYGLKQGDEIDVAEEGNTLLLTSKGEIPSRECTIKVEKPERLISRQLFNTYRKGYDNIRVEFDDPSILGYLQSKISMLMGFEIMESGENYCILRNIARIEEKEFDNILRRMLLLTKTIAKDSFEAARDSKYSLLDNVIQLEATQNKLYLFCSRAINKIGNIKIETPSLMYLFVQRVEDIADSYKAICEEIKDKKLVLNKETLGLYSDVNDYLDSLYDFFYSFDNIKGKRIMEEKKRLLDRAGSLLEKIPKKEIFIIHLLMEAIIDIYEASSPVFGMNIFQS